MAGTVRAQCCAWLKAVLNSVFITIFINRNFGKNMPKVPVGFEKSACPLLRNTLGKDLGKPWSNAWLLIHSLYIGPCGSGTMSFAGTVFYSHLELCVYPCLLCPAFHLLPPSSLNALCSAVSCPKLQAQLHGNKENQNPTSLDPRQLHQRTLSVWWLYRHIARLARGLLSLLQWHIWDPGGGEET